MKPSDTDKRMADVVLEAHRRGFTVQSNYARDQADYIGMASSLGLISTKLYGNVFSREWRPTSKGLEWLEDVFGVVVEDDAEIHEGHDD
jgi:hypothetical protein